MYAPMDDPADMPRHKLESALNLSRQVVYELTKKIERLEAENKKLREGVDKDSKSE